VLGEAGCTDEEIRAITGHADRAVVARYVRPNTAMATMRLRSWRRIGISRRSHEFFSVAAPSPAQSLDPKSA